MDTHIAIRTNGRGNAWPKMLGQESMFYKKNDYANSSFSIQLRSEKNDDFSSILWDVLVDAGHGVIQYYLEHNNRIPEAIVITHPHHDHTFSLDWFVQSAYRTQDRKLSVYASSLCINNLKQHYPQLHDIIEYKELCYGKVAEIQECPGLQICAYPVFHGIKAEGACLMQFIYNKKSYLFTGDILTPLFRDADIPRLKNSEVLYVDANNLFPYPKSNHWSISSEQDKYLHSWKMKDNIAYFISPHISTYSPEEDIHYINSLIKEKASKNNFIYSIIDFVKIVTPKQTYLVHYGGAEDISFHNSNLLTEEDILNKTKTNHTIAGSIAFPKTGELFFPD